jgi:carbon monoxide dehydrogenase subunit G
MTTLERSILIHASPEEIDAITLDGWRLPEWYAGIQQAEPDDVYPHPSGVVHTNYKAAGVNFNITMTSLEHVHGQSLTLQMDGMISGTSRWVYAPEGDGTRVAVTFEYEVPGGGLGQALDKLLVERMNAENLERSLENLKALVEG